MSIFERFYWSIRLHTVTFIITLLFFIGCLIVPPAGIIGLVILFLYEPRYLYKKLEKQLESPNPNYKTIIKYMRLLCQDVPEAKETLAGLYYNGNGCEKDHEKAFKLYLERGSFLQKESSFYQLGMMYDTGDCCPVDRQKALACFQKAPSYSNAQKTVEEEFQATVKELEDRHFASAIPKLLNFQGKLKPQCIENLRKLTEEKDVSRQDLLLAQFFEQGFDEASYKNKAENYLKKSLDAGGPDAAFFMARNILQESPDKMDFASLLSYLETAAQTITVAQFAVGLFYAAGIGHAREYPKALSFLTLSADHGNVFAAYLAGRFYSSGIGTDPDLEKARHYLKIADTCVEHASDYATAAFNKLIHRPLENAARPTASVLSV